MVLTQKKWKRRQIGIRPKYLLVYKKNKGELKTDRRRREEKKRREGKEKEEEEEEKKKRREEERKSKKV